MKRSTPVPAEEREKWSIDKMFSNIYKMVRRDKGGKESIEEFPDFPNTHLSKDDFLTRLAELHDEEVVSRLEGIKQAIAHTINEFKRRFRVLLGT